MQSLLNKSSQYLLDMRLQLYRRVVKSKRQSLMNYSKIFESLSWQQLQFIKSMNSLKFALSKDEAKPTNKEGINGSLLRGVNKSKAEGIWALDMDNNAELTEESLQNDNLLKILREKLDAAFQKDSKTISEITFQRVIQQFQDEAGGSKSELSCLRVIDDKIGDISQFAKDDFKKFLNIFSNLLDAKISKLRKKQKNSQLVNYDKIVSGNFKKKQEKNFLQVESAKPIRKSREKDRLESGKKQKAGSNDNKLNRLFSKDKNQLREKDSSRKEGMEQGGFNATTLQGQDESVSFSTVLATSVAVKTRRRKQSNDFQQKKEKPFSKQQNDERHKQKDQGDEAFIFYRPKKGKK